MCQEGAGSVCDGTCLELSAADMVWWTNVFKTLGDPVRLRLLMQLAERSGAEAAVHELADVGVSPATVSHHLKRLRCIGLIESRRDGRLVYYRLGDGVRSALTQILHQRSRVVASQAPQPHREPDPTPPRSEPTVRGGRPNGETPGVVGHLLERR